MVELKELTVQGLYSYDGDSQPPTRLSLSKSNVIVGPNNSGKSNLLRIVRLFAESLPPSSKRPSEDEVFSNKPPVLSAELVFSNSEAKTLLDFLRVYRVRDAAGERTYVYDYKNFDRLVELCRRARLTLGWPLGYFPTTRDNVFELELIDLGVRFHAPNGTGTIYVVDDVRDSMQNGFKGKQPESNLAGLLDGISLSADPQAASHKVFVEDSTYFTIQDIQDQYLTNASEDHRRMFQQVLISAGFPPSQNSQITFSSILGSILRNKIIFTSGGTIFGKATVEADHVAQTPVATQAASADEPLQYTNRLEADGWNLGQFLFSLKESNILEQRKRFRAIRESFQDLFPSLSFDVLPRYVSLGQENFQQRNIPQVPHHTYIIVTDSTNSKQFELDRVGAGLAESLFLLAAAIGVEDSVILLDEPAVNLHPPQMKALMDKLVATKSQIIVATHSPKLVHNLIFDFNANLFYVRRTGAKSIATQLNAALHFEDEDRYKLSYQIDTRVFFANRIVMCEGEADREFLDIAARHYDMEIDKRENIIVDVGSNGNFGKYSRVLNNIGIPFTILADGDNHDDNTLRKARCQVL